MKKLNFTQFALSTKEMKSLNGGDTIVVPIITPASIVDFNSSRSNRERGN
jgi:natural product precursor